MEFWDYVSSIVSRIPKDAWDLFELKGTLWALLFWIVVYGIAKWKNRARHMQKMKLEARSFTIATLMSCGIAFLFLLFIYSPYQHYKQLYSSNQTAQDDVRKLQQPAVKDEGSKNIIADLTQKLLDSERRNDRADTTAGQMRSEIAILRSELDQAQHRLRATETTKADKVKRAIIREQLGRFLSESETIWNQCAEIAYGDECQSQKWVNEVKMFLADKLDSSYVERFVHPEIPALGVYPGSSARSSSLKKLDGQKAFLREVMKEQS
jgi:hypothetical protein